MKKIILIIFLYFFIPTSVLLAADILPSNIIALDSAQGQKIFFQERPAQQFWNLIQQFVTQDNLTYCSAASVVMVLNALKIEAPNDPIYKSYHIFTQNNFFSPEVEKKLPVALVKKQGATLDQIAAALSVFPIVLKTIHANNVSIETFRKDLIASLHHKDTYAIVNFGRPQLSEKGGGHMSPIAGYDLKSDRMLLLDVARYRFPPAWIKTEDLWRATNTIDNTANAYRGYILISKRIVK